MTLFTKDFIPYNIYLTSSIIRQPYIYDVHINKCVRQPHLPTHSFLKLLSLWRTVTFQNRASFSFVIIISSSIIHHAGVGHPKLTEVVDTCLVYNLHAKLTGAGGGGCAFALVPRGSTILFFVLAPRGSILLFFVNWSLIMLLSHP